MYCLPVCLCDAVVLPQAPLAKQVSEVPHESVRPVEGRDYISSALGKRHVLQDDIINLAARDVILILATGDTEIPFS